MPDFTQLFAHLRLASPHWSISSEAHNSVGVEGICVPIEAEVSIQIESSTVYSPHLHRLPSTQPYPGLASPRPALCNLRKETGRHNIRIVS